MDTANNEIGESVPMPGPFESSLTLPDLDQLTLNHLQYVFSELSAYQAKLCATLWKRQEERRSELEARIKQDQEELAALSPGKPPARLENPSNTKYRDPEKPENTWTGRGRKPQWIQEKIDGGANLDDFLVGMPAKAEAPSDTGF